MSANRSIDVLTWSKVLFPRLGKLLVRPNAILMDFPISHAVELAQLPHGATCLVSDIDFSCAAHDGARIFQNFHCLCLEFDVAFLGFTASCDHNPMLINHTEKRSATSLCRM